MQEIRNSRLACDWFVLSAEHLEKWTQKTVPQAVCMQGRSFTNLRTCRFLLSELFMALCCVLSLPVSFWKIPCYSVCCKSSNAKHILYVCFTKKKKKKKKGYNHSMSKMMLFQEACCRSVKHKAARALPSVLNSLFRDPLSKPPRSLRSRLLLHLILSTFFINSCYSRLWIFHPSPPFNLFLRAFFSLYNPRFWQPGGTRSAISKQFITCRMFWVQYPCSHLHHTRPLSIPPPRSPLSLQQNEFFCLKGYLSCTHILSHTHTHSCNTVTFNMAHIHSILLFITSISWDRVRFKGWCLCVNGALCRKSIFCKQSQEFIFIFVTFFLSGSQVGATERGHTGQHVQVCKYMWQKTA